MTRKQKTRLIQAAVILAATAGTLWDIPSKRALVNVKAEAMHAGWGRGRRMRSAEMVMAVINDPTKTDPLAAMINKRLSDARRLMNKRKDRLHAAMRTFELMKDKDKQGTTRRRVASGKETLRIGALNREPIAGQLEAEAREEEGGTTRILFRKLQGPVVGMAQAAILLCGQLETDRTGFATTFNATFPTLSINEGTNGEWKAKATNAISQAIVCQLSDRPGGPRW